eukprot:3646789-Karenia_brevis.AAC.1
MLEATQNSQDAQAGYACDYQNKRAARACNEVKEFVKGHRDLHTRLQDKDREYIAKRHMQRILSDLHGKGT